MVDELYHHVFELALAHLAVADEDPRIGDELLNFVRHLQDVAHAIVDEIDLPLSLKFPQNRELHPLAVTTSTRLEVLPDIPTVAEFVPGYEASGWFGIGAPKNTPAAIVDRLNKEINLGLADPQMKSKLSSFGYTIVGGTSADFGKLIADETEKWAKVVKFAGIKPE